jgi:calcium-dependent protein kinase
MKQVLSVVSYCHRNDIIHRDLKPENLLLVNNQELNIKVIDFGTSALAKSGKRLKLNTGSAYYVAPEVLKKNYTKACDVWSCGVIMYILLCGYAPFNGKTVEEIYRKVSAGRYNFPKREWCHVSNQAKDLITKMMKMNERGRITAEKALKHPWFTLYAKNQGSAESTKLAIANLKQFRAEKKLQHAFLNFLAEQVITSEDTQELNKIFVDLDKDNDGRLSKKELLDGYR